MTVVADICGELERMGPPAEGKERFVLLGVSAWKAAEAVARAKGIDKPVNFGTQSGSRRYPIVHTDQFKGWEIVDKPIRGVRS